MIIIALGALNAYALSLFGVGFFCFYHDQMTDKRRP